MAAPAHAGDDDLLAGLTGFQLGLARPHQTANRGARQPALIGARRTGQEAVAVGYGFGSREVLTAEQPAYHFATLGELLRASEAERAAEAAAKAAEPPHVEQPPLL